ncbi:hypothetical protein G7554_000197 [Salmonella enterica subsp. enterica serovar Saintpaul]|nr:hypothetical protein [Salmonella enterica subsp. enterica serovar Saintpaul]
MIRELLSGVREAYALCYPNREVGLINRCSYQKRYIDNDGSWEREKIEDTGICFGVAMMVQDCLKLKFRVSCEIVYVYRRYDAEEGDGFEDVLVHATLFYNGKFYDTDDYVGVERFEDLAYIRKFDGLGVQMHYPSFPERGDSGSRDEIPNKITPVLYKAIENIFSFDIPRRNVF